MNALKDEERDFNLVRAETNRAIAKTRLAVEDEAKSYDERIKALDTAIKLEQETIDEQLRLAKELRPLSLRRWSKARALRRTYNAKPTHGPLSSNSKPHRSARKSTRR